MKYNKIMQKIERNLDSKSNIRRYSLADMITESYKSLYGCEKGSNLYNIVESHLEDIRKNPKDIDRLSRQLSTIKEMSRMIEFNKLKDEDLVSKDKYDTVEANKKRNIGSVKESEMPHPSNGPRIGSKVRILRGGYRGQVGEVVDFDSDPEEGDQYSVKAPDGSIRYLDDTDIELVKDNLEEDIDLTDEELDELTKHLEEIRKNKKMKECDAPKKGVKESTKPRKLKRANESIPVWSRYRIVDPDGEIIDSYTDRKDAEDWITQLYKDGDYKKGELKVVDSQSKNESKSYEKLNLSEFNKKSASKAFVKTFKKLDKKLHEGTALTRQESISLYKAANSVMTHLSVELEHNPKFLSTFKECTSLLSKDVNSVLGSLREGKAPSKKTMKSLAKFSEALLRESYSIEELTMDAYAHFTDDLGRTPTVDDVLEYLLNNYDVSGISDSTPAEAGKAYDKVASILRQNHVEINESEEEEDLPPIEDEENEFISDEEGSIDSEESEEFDQEYADARVELHKELADEHAESEDPGVQDKLNQDKEEVTSLPGITDEQIAELEGEDNESSDDEKETEVQEESAKTDKDVENISNTDDSEITDDELAELKKYLKEMRRARN